MRCNLCYGHGFSHCPMTFSQRPRCVLKMTLAWFTSELSRHFSSFPTSLTIESPHLSRLLPWLPLPLSLIHSTCWYISLARTHCSHLPQFWLCSIRIFLIHTNNLRSLLKKILWYFSCLLYCLYSRFIINLLIILSVKFEFAFFILKCNMSYHFT